MIRRGSRWLLLTSTLACATAPSAPAPPSGDHLAITVDPAAVAQGEHALAAWIAYGAARAKLFEGRQGRVRNQTGDDFALELAARAALADVWGELRAKADKPNAYLDLLFDVRQAGYLDEYVVTYFARPGWTVPGESLGDFDLAGFTRWGQTRLRDHQPVTLVTATPEKVAPWPDPPAATLPDPAAFLPKRVPCAESRPRIIEALAAWSREEQRLDGSPLAAADRAEFARLVDWARAMPEYRRSGVTWISPRPAELEYVLGFCAVDRKDLKEASSALRASVRLAPLAPGTRLELAQVLVLQKQLDEADREVDGVLATTTERCELGRAWRQRGYILVERGRLEEGYAAYQKSLEHDPGSRLALDELVFIAREVERLGGSAARAFKPYQPPPGAARQVVTECQGE
jgi:tetratricopeptide (TPR) repeat protein